MGQADGHFSITVDDRLEINIDFNNHDTEYSQFLKHIAQYNIMHPATIFNLQRWARNRNIPFNIRVHGFFSPLSWWYRFILQIDKYLDKQGDTVMPPKWDE